MSALAQVRPLKAVVYTRISHDPSGEAQGVERQAGVCLELADHEGYDVVAVLTDNDLSAFSGKARPAYEQMLELVNGREVDVVIAYHADRLYRRLSDLVQLTDVVKRAGVEIRTVSAGNIDLNTASGRFQAQVIGAAAEHEAARLGERVKMKFHANAKAGKAHGGGRPFGYARAGDLEALGVTSERQLQRGEIVVVPAEAALIREAAERILRGASLNSIVVDWNERGIPTVNGGKWRPNSLTKMLRAGRNAAVREMGGEIIGPGNWQPILDRPTWERLRSRIDHGSTTARPRRHLLAGMVVCGVCDTKMRTTSGGNGKYRTPSYACDKAVRHGCGSNSAKAAAVDSVVLDYVFKALETVDLAGARLRRDTDTSGHLVDEIAADEQLLADLAVDVGNREMSHGEWQAAAKPIRERMKRNRRALESIHADVDAHEVLPIEGVTPETFDALDLEQKRAIVRLFVDHVVVAKGRPGRTFDPTRARPVPAGSAAVYEK